MKNQRLVPNSKNLRTNLTDAEQKIWRHIRQRQLNNLKFRRQQIIGNYIVDFICFEKKLIIEIDGGQHTDENDRKRTNFLEKEGYKILRFWNNDVLNNIEGVLEKIFIDLNEDTPILTFPPQGGRN